MLLSMLLFHPQYYMPNAQCSMLNTKKKYIYILTNSKKNKRLGQQRLFIYILIYLFNTIFEVIYNSKKTLLAS